MERLTFILDDEKFKDWETEYAGMKRNKAFLKSIGIPSDSVGWGKLELDHPGAEEKIKQIQEYCKLHKKKMRIWYQWQEEFKDSDWYWIKPTYLETNFEAYKVNQETGEETICGIRAYKIPKRSSFLSFQDMPSTEALVSKEFTDSVKKYHLTGAEFAWANDVGKYKAVPFFRMINMNTLEYFYESPSEYAEYLMEEHKKEMDYIYGPNWTWLNQYDFTLSLGYIDVFPIPGGKEPGTDFACCNDLILASRHAVQCLLKDQVLGKDQVIPCHFIEEIPFGYQKSKCKKKEILSELEIRAIHQEYAVFLEKERPEREIKQKEVLTMLRRFKKIKPDDFYKPLKKANRDSLKNTPYEPVEPFSSISDGMILSDEYRIFSYQQMLQETLEYEQERIEEETLDLPDAAAIGKAMDGDRILLEGKMVKRYSHEDYTLLEEWNSMEAFFYEILESEDEIE